MLPAPLPFNSPAQGVINNPGLSSGMARPFFAPFSGSAVSANPTASQRQQSGGLHQWLMKIWHNTLIPACDDALIMGLRILNDMHR